MENPNRTCKNCGNQFQLNFCNNCGQTVNTHRITWREVGHLLPHALFHLDEGFLYTLKQLTFRPGYTVRDYLTGKRKDHYNPLLMLILVAGVCSILYVYFHLPTLLASVNLDKLEEKNSTLSHKFFAIRMIFLGFVCSIGDFLLFKQWHYRLSEIVVLNIFILCGVEFIQLCFIPFLILAKEFHFLSWIRIVVIIVSLVYLFLARYQFYDARGNRLLQARIISVLLFCLLIIMLTALFIVKPYFNS